METPSLSPGHLAMEGGAGAWPGVSPALYQLHRGCAQHPVRKQVDLFHDVGQAHGQLLPEEGEGGFLTGITGPWREREREVSARSCTPLEPEDVSRVRLIQSFIS